MPLTEAIDKATSPHQPPHCRSKLPTTDASPPLESLSLIRSFKLTSLRLSFTPIGLQEAGILTTYSIYSKLILTQRAWLQTTDRQIHSRQACHRGIRSQALSRLLMQTMRSSVH